MKKNILRERGARSERRERERVTGRMMEYVRRRNTERVILTHDIFSYYFKLDIPIHSYSIDPRWIVRILFILLYRIIHGNIIYSYKQRTRNKHKINIKLLSCIPFKLTLSYHTVSYCIITMAFGGAFVSVAMKV
jgi:hypothetical protein